jgi:hypothetical protein
MSVPPQAPTAGRKPAQSSIGCAPFSRPLDLAVPFTMVAGGPIRARIRTRSTAK